MLIGNRVEISDSCREVTDWMLTYGEQLNTENLSAAFKYARENEISAIVVYTKLEVVPYVDKNLKVVWVVPEEASLDSDFCIEETIVRF